jgi:hypothetical protein
MTLQKKANYRSVVVWGKEGGKDEKTKKTF